MQNTRVNYNYNNLSSERTYSLALGGSILLGLIVSLICSYLFTSLIMPLEMAHPFIFTIAYIVLVTLVGNMAVRSRSAGASFAFYMLETIIVGALLSTYIPFLPSNIIGEAFGFTSITVLGMIFVSMIYPNAFAKMGKGLCIAILISIVVELGGYFLFGYDMAIMDYVVIAIFALYVGYDWVKGMSYPKTTKYAVVTAVNLYLDIINLFVRFASILMRSNRNN